MVLKQKGRVLVGSLESADETLDISGENIAVLGSATLSLSSPVTTLPGADVEVPNLRDEVALTAAAATSVTLEDKALVCRKLTLTVTDLVLSLTQALDYIGAKLCDLPDSNLMLLGCEVDLECVKGETSNGLESGTDITLAIGTAVASASTLATTMENVIELQLLDADDATPAYLDHSESNATALPITLADGATNALYLNLAAAVTADDTLTCTGTVTLYYVDLGNLSS